jgi:hypothetical protein
MNEPIDRKKQISLMANSKERIEQRSSDILQSCNVQSMICRKPKNMTAQPNIATLAAENKLLREALKQCATELYEVYVAEYETPTCTPEEIKAWVQAYFDIVEGGKHNQC